MADLDYKDGAPRTIKVKLSIDRVKNEIVSEILDDPPGLLKMLNAVDARDYLEILKPKQKKSLENTNRRKHSKDDLKADDLVRTDDYAGEPSYIHPGIHLRFNGQDSIEWSTDEPTNLVIEVGADPELVLLDKKLSHKEVLTNEMVQSSADSKYNPFDSSFPKICSKDNPAKAKLETTGGKPETRVQKQRYYKYHVYVLGAEAIKLDPHIEGHDD
jgi:hypothetical protein